MASTCSPTLPPELEKELCALSQLASIPKLMLVAVAQRVKEWYVRTAAETWFEYVWRVEPLLYRTIILGNPTQITGLPLFTDEIMSSLHRLPTFFHRAVRYLVLFPPRT